MNVLMDTLAVWKIKGFQSNLSQFVDTLTDHIAEQN